MRIGPFFSFHFSKPLKFVVGLPKWKFSAREKAFQARKKIRKMTLPLRKNFLVRPLPAYIRHPIYFIQNDLMAVQTYLA